MFIFTGLIIITIYSGVSSYDTKNITGDCIEATLDIRKKAGAAFIPDEELVELSHDRCVTILESSNWTHIHDNDTYGENIYWEGKIQSNPDCSIAVAAWMAEKKNLSRDFTQDHYKDIGHFTQLVWKESINIGCAQCKRDHGNFEESVIVCDFSPPGNVNNDYLFHKNVNETFFPITPRTDIPPTIAIKIDIPPIDGMRTDIPPTIAIKIDIPPIDGMKTDIPPLSPGP